MPLVNPMSVVPFLFFIVFFLLYYGKSPNEFSASWRAAFLAAAVTWGIFVVSTTEVLSSLHLLQLDWVLGAWGLATTIAIAPSIILFRRGALTRSLPTTQMSRLEKALIAALFLIGCLTLAVSLLAPPNNFDSMTYHMSRVVHWIQNRDVAFYPTNILRQLHQGPWAEFAIMHLQIISGGDYFANLVQWFSMIGSAIGVSMIAKTLGADRRGQILASVIAMTIPMGILQASSTQNDYVVAFWLVCFVHYLTRMIIRQQVNWSSSMGASMALGLAILTKATAYLFAAPFLVWFALCGLGCFRLQAWSALVLMAIVSFAINFGHFQRNLDLYGSPLGPGTEAPGTEYQYAYKYVNDVFTIPSLISGVTRNTALHLQSPITAIDFAIEEGITALHLVMGIGVNDPRTTWGRQQFHIPSLSTHEDSTGNTAHLLLILTTATLMIIVKPRQLLRTAYLAAMVVSFLLFCFILKWQPWNSRLQLPLFVLWSPVMAVALRLPKGQKGTSMVVVGLLLLGLPWLVYNNSRPLIGSNSILTTSRIDQYFANRPGLKSDYEGAVQFVASEGCTQIGLSTGADDWEYPLWVLFDQANIPGVRLEHVNVQNVSAVKASQESFLRFDPCAVISIGLQPNHQLVTGSGVYSQEWSQGRVAVLARQDQ